MVSNRRISTRACAVILVFLMALPPVVQAASDEDFAVMRAQMKALSARLDRLETENRELSAVNAEMAQANRQTAVAVAQVSEQSEAVAVEVQKQSEATDWTDTIRWKGDFRYRYESFNIEGNPYRDRYRIRARANLVADVSPTVEVGLGMASGGEDPVSSNQTLGGGGSTKGLNLDLAYFDWSGMANTRVLGGKFKNYLVDSGRNALLWDRDWRPEGIGFSWANDFFFVNALGTWIESDSRKEQSFAYATQAGVTASISDDVSLLAGVGYYVFDTRGLRSFFGDDNDFFGNSFDPDTLTYLYSYEEIEFFAGIKFSLFNRPLLVFGNYIQNQAVDDNDTAWSYGFEYGKASNLHDWGLAYTYKYLEADAAFGLLVDSDFGGGGTDARGHVFRGSYGLARNMAAQITYFVNDAGLKSGNPVDFNRLQLDLNFKYK